MDTVASPACSDNTIGLLRGGARDFDAILFAPTGRTRLCCSHEYAPANRRGAPAVARKTSTMAHGLRSNEAVTVSDGSCEWKKQF
jgi:hypothetical protein